MRLGLQVAIGTTSPRRSCTRSRGSPLFSYFHIRNQTFLISDGQDLSTTDLLKEIALASNKSILLFPIPVSIIQWLFGVTGKSSIAERLFGNLQVDTSKCYDLLGWTPPVKVRQGLQLAISRVPR